ncbi:MAG: hypothetical protein FWG87_01520 [Defluviitaleaceae bacterium]|nr:hypothetical protein [Defluviitaleaceae bacterium]
MENDTSYILCGLASSGWCYECDECISDEYDDIFIEIAAEERERRKARANESAIQ